MRRLPEGSPIPRHTRGPFVSGSPILPGDKGAIAFFRVKHFSPRYKFYESGSRENDPRETFHPGGNIY
jgi:hypothetical protein